jgi:peptidoglycan glycosyltransferase
MAAALVLVGLGLLQNDVWEEREWLLCLAGVAVLTAFSWWPRAPRGAPIFSRTVVRWSTLLLAVFFVLTVQLVRIQLVESSRIASHVEVTANGDVVRNPRLHVRGNDAERGRILDVNGGVLVESVVLDDGASQRRYYEPSTFGVIGYYSPLLFGGSQVEAAYDEYLAGQQGGNPVERWLDGILHRSRPGYDVVLTIDLELQQLADELLAGRPGAVVLMDPQTGELLTLAGTPGYDPNHLYITADNASDERIAFVQQYWEQLVNDPAAPLVFRPTLGEYTPGSTFKTITASGAIERDVATPETVYRDEGSYEVDGRVIIELNRPDETQANWTMEEAYAYSLNVVFAQIGLQLGGEALWETAQQFGFGQELPFPLPVSISSMASDESALQSRTLVADTAFGQGLLQLTPLHLALTTAAIINGGVLPEPVIAVRAQERSGEVVEEFSGGDWLHAIDEATAEQVRDLMLASVDYGYASGAQIDGAVVGGKTGTAETGSGATHAWFTGFAEQDGRQLVVAVVVENGGRGGEVALPIGRAMLEAALAQSD